MKALSMTLCTVICCMGNPAAIAYSSCTTCSDLDYDQIQRNIELRNMQWRQQEIEQQMQQQQMKRNYYRN